MIDLSGMHVLVTGGSRGIGAATARLFARAGAAVLIQYREREAEAEALVDELYSISDQEHRRFPCDFLQPSEIVERKIEVLRELEAAALPDAVIASNTSSIMIGERAADFVRTELAA